ncbi:hypothetical protein QE422_004009 [Chryseobacterium sp. SORGH_AS 447]|nr:hypothetical protein [Chryseobacterium sp. SORGH_AS_0447]
MKKGRIISLYTFKRGLKVSQIQAFTYICSIA